MKPLNPTARAWLKGVHVLVTAAWVGAAICMSLLTLVARPANGHELHGLLAALKLIDDWVVIPSAMASLLTGLLISWLTPWGFFKWRWVTVKWIGTLAIILFGTFFLGPWLNGMEAIAASEPLTALQNEIILSNHRAMVYGVGPQLLTLLVLTLISVLKPWKRAAKR